MISVDTPSRDTILFKETVLGTILQSADFFSSYIYCKENLGTMQPELEFNSGNCFEKTQNYETCAGILGCHT
jgi:hypothetical protein